MRGVIGMALAESIDAVPSWTRTVALVRERAALRAVITRGTRLHRMYACYVDPRAVLDTENPAVAGLHEERMMGLEPTTFCMASRRSSQLSYIRATGRV
jgi:hypothetical protein